jgi:hypothetical protein
MVCFISNTLTRVISKHTPKLYLHWAFVLAVCSWLLCCVYRTVFCILVLNLWQLCIGPQQWAWEAWEAWQGRSVGREDREILKHPTGWMRKFCLLLIPFVKCLFIHLQPSHQHGLTLKCEIQATSVFPLYYFYYFIVKQPPVVV